MVVPLTRLTYIKRKFEWTQVKQGDFEKNNWIVARNNLLSYPYYNETFKICTNVSAFQLGEVVSQKGKPIAFYSIKLTGVQQQYIVT